MYPSPISPSSENSKTISGTGASRDLTTLLNFVGDNFCKYRDLGHDNYKSLLLSYSDASSKFGSLEVKKVIETSENFKVTAVAIAAIKCPQHIVK